LSEREESGMKHEMVVKLHKCFEEIAQLDESSGVEYWYARDLQVLLSYSKWENFVKVIAKAITSCETSGYESDDHFLGVRKMVPLGSGAERAVDDFMLTRYACYLIAQNGDPSKDAIAFAQTYFAAQTRKQELIEKRLSEQERINARKKLTESERVLSGIIFERVSDERSFGRIRSKGDKALFGGNTTNDMKSRMGVPKNRPLADFLPTITIKAKDFANEITNFNIKKDDLRTEDTITQEHMKNNADVRRVLTGRGIAPESLPPDEDLKKIERRIASEEKKLPKNVKPLEGGSTNPQDRP
jgi:DNA-damage-inducible protein D